MEENDQMIKRKKSFFERIKEGILKIFSKKEKVKEIDSASEIQEVEENTPIENNKIVEIYQKIKVGEIELETLDKETLYKIMALSSEEIELIDKKIKEVKNKTKNIRENTEIYNRELEMLTRA